MSRVSPFYKKKFGDVEIMHPQKIVIAATEIGTGGLGSYLMTVGKGLTSRGHDIHLVATNVRGDLFDQMKAFVPCYDLTTIPLSAKKVFAAADIVNHISPDILLMNNCSLLHYALPLVRTETKPVVVLHSDDARFYKVAVSFGGRIFRWIAPTEGVADTCKAYLTFKQRQRVQRIPHGVQNRMFYPDGQIEEKRAGNICFVGYIAENKGADLLPAIFMKVLAEYQDARLTVIGHGPLEQYLKERFAENGILGKCIFTGLISCEEVAAALRTCSVLLLPTRIEGFGLSIVEAMMSGLVPVISRLTGVTDEIIHDGTTGMLVNPNDTDGFATAIIELLRNPERLKAMSASARTIAIQRYPAEKMLDRYEALFAEDDDRGRISSRGTFGWFNETVGEVLRRGVDRRWLMNRALELWR
jgi:glycosyltransferase involved in cell wall biosynthesis